MRGNKLLISKEWQHLCPSILLTLQRGIHSRQTHLFSLVIFESKQWTALLSDAGPVVRNLQQLQASAPHRHRDLKSIYKSQLTQYLQSYAEPYSRDLNKNWDDRSGRILQHLCFLRLQGILYLHGRRGLTSRMLRKY